MNPYKFSAYSVHGDEYAGNGFTSWWMLIVWIHAHGNAMYARFGNN
jgi:hypothetical protein